MKLTVKNFGPVKEAEVEVNNLNILMGDNNGGKTWLSYLLYDSLRFLYFNLEVQNNDFKEEKKVFVKIPKAFNPFTKFNVIQSVFSNDIPLFTLNSDNKSKSRLRNLFNVSELDFEVLPENISCEANDNDVFFFVAGLSDQSTVEKPTLTERNHESKEDYIIREINIKTQLKESITIFGVLSINNRSFFSSERMGISLFYKALDKNNEKIIRNLQSKFLFEDDDLELFRKEAAYYVEPVSDNIEFTRNIERYQSQISKLDVENALSVFEKLIDGKFNKLPNSEITFVYNNKSKNTIDVPLYLASSAARSLSDLYFYLVHVAKKNDVIFIDEPESHLTLDRQRIMAKLLVAIANAGVKVWVTTHSDFMVREVNNLIKLSADLPGKAAFLKEYAGEYTEQDCIKPDEVNMYNMVKGKVTKIEITEKGMASDSFLDEAIHKANTISMDINYFLAQEEDEVNE